MIWFKLHLFSTTDQDCSNTPELLPAPITVQGIMQELEVFTLNSVYLLWGNPSWLPSSFWFILIFLSFKTECWNHFSWGCGFLFPSLQKQNKQINNSKRDLFGFKDANGSSQATELCKGLKLSKSAGLKEAISNQTAPVFTGVLIIHTKI